jgi:hypothetical protein
MLEVLFKGNMRRGSIVLVIKAPSTCAGVALKPSPTPLDRVFGFLDVLYPRTFLGSIVSE